VTNGLLGLEIAAATALLAVALTMVAQSRYVAARPLGFNMKDLYAINATCGTYQTRTVAPSNVECSAAFDRPARGMPEVKHIAYSSNSTILTTASPQKITRPGGSERLGEGFSMAVDAEFLPLAGAKLLAGRMFDPNSAYDRILIDAYPNY